MKNTVFRRKPLSLFTRSTVDPAEQIVTSISTQLWTFSGAGKAAYGHALVINAESRTAAVEHKRLETNLRQLLRRAEPRLREIELLTNCAPTGRLRDVVVTARVQGSQGQLSIRLRALSPLHLRVVDYSTTLPIEP